MSKQIFNIPVYIFMAVMPASYEIIEEYQMLLTNFLFAAKYEV